MPQALSALFCGLLLGSGLLVSGMTDPGEVLAFLDLQGNWSPALLGVLGSAVAVSLAGFAHARRLPHPWLAERFSGPVKTTIDAPLLVGGTLFGVGWGLVGYCPGPALAGLALGNPEAPWFVGAMIAGGLLQDYVHAAFRRHLDRQ